MKQIRQSADVEILESEEQDTFELWPVKKNNVWKVLFLMNDGANDLTVNLQPNEARALAEALNRMADRTETK